MKKTKVGMLVVALAVFTLTGCSNKQEDTGVIISAEDSAEKSVSANTVVEDSTSVEVIENSTTELDAATEEAANTTETTESTTDERLFGTWTSPEGDILLFESNGDLNGYEVSTNTNLYGTYETDNETYINITLTDRFELVEDEEGNLVETPLEDLEKHYEILSYTYTDEEASLILSDGSTELTLNKAMELIYEEHFDDDVIEGEATPEEQEQINATALELGIDPETGLPLETITE